MEKQELIEELKDMRDSNCSVVEMWEFIEDNTDLDPTEFAEYLI